MKTELVFKLEREPQGYGVIFSPNCKINIVNTKGVLYLDYNKRHPVGMFENLRQQGELLMADVEIFENVQSVEHRFEYAIQGDAKRNENDECIQAEIYSVSALMPSKD